MWTTGKDVKNPKVRFDFLTLSPKENPNLLLGRKTTILCCGGCESCDVGDFIFQKKKCNPCNAPSLSLLLCVNGVWCQPSKGQRGSIIQEFPVIRAWTWIMPRPGAYSPWRRQRRWSLSVFQLADPTLIPHKGSWGGREQWRDSLDSAGCQRTGEEASTLQ